MRSGPDGAALYFCEKKNVLKQGVFAIMYEKKTITHDIYEKIFG